MSANATGDFELKVAADYQQLVDDIESLMSSPTGVDPATVARLNARYERAVKSINARLRECDELLKKGLRNEALERCEVEPKLLDLFLTIDFPERDSWEDTVRQCELTVPDLLVSVAGDLNDAYATEKPLAELKYQVRLHALARSPLPIRIGLMRRLAKQDQNSNVWDEDLKIFERARHNQLAGEVQGAIKAGNATALADLMRELQSPEWTTPPANGLLKQVADAYSQLQRRQAREQLVALEPELNAAFAAFDVHRGREIREDWRKSAAIAALPASDPLLQSIEPALQWLEDQDQQQAEELAYDAALRALIQALDSAAARPILEERYQALMTLGRGIPDAVKERLEQRLRQMERQKSRSLQLKLASAALGLVLVLAVVFYVVNNARFRSQLQAQVSALEKMLQDKEIPAAEAHLEKLDKEFPRLAATAEIQRIKTDLKTAQEQNVDRKAQLDELLSSARREGVDAATYQSVPNAIESLKKAWAMATYSSEKAEVTELTKLVEAKRSELQQQLNGEFSGEYDKVRQEFDGLKAAPLDHLDDLESLKTRALALMKREGVSEDVQATRRPLLAEISQAISKGQSMQGEARILLEMNATIGDRTKYFGHMDRYIKTPEFAGQTRHNDFVRAMKSDAPLITAFHEWSLFLDDLMHRDLTTLNPDFSGKIRTDAERLMKDHPGFPYTPQIQEILQFLGKSANRARGSPSMEQLLALKTFKVFSVRSDGKQYYLPFEPAAKDATGNISSKYFIDTEFKSTKQSPRLSMIDHDSKWRSPQMIYEMEASELLGSLQDKKGANWDQTFIELLEKLYGNQDMDPILKVQLISHTIRAAADGSPFLSKRLEKVKSKIDSGNLNNSANWVSPDDTEVMQERKRAESLLKQVGGELRDMKAISAESQQLSESFKHPKFDIHYQWTGWMYRDHQDPSRKWTCTFKPNGPVNSQGDLFVIVKSNTGQVNFVRIGQIQQRQPRLDEETRELVEGRPVFEKIDAASRKSKPN